MLAVRAHGGSAPSRAAARPHRGHEPRTCCAVAGRAGLADHDQGDYVGIAAEMARIGGLESDREAAEARWFELSELLG